MVSQRQKSALFQKEAVERSEKNLCVFRIIDAFQGSSMQDVLSSIVPGPPPKVVLPRVIQGRKVLYRLVLDPQVVVLGLPPHILACLLGYLSNVFPTGPSWAAALTECDLSDSGPLEHATRGAAALVTLLEIIPRFRAVHVAVTQDPHFQPMVLDLLQTMLHMAAGPLWQQLQAQQSPADQLITGRAICGCVCWGIALLVSVWGIPGPDAQPGSSDFLYSQVVRRLLSHPRGPKIVRVLLDAASIMLLTLHQLLQAPSLPQNVQEELSVHSGGALHHVGQLFSHPLMYNAALIISPGGCRILRVLTSACCLADLLEGNAASREAIVPLLVARCNSLLVQLSEFRSPALLDTLCESAAGKARVHYYLAMACGLAQRCLQPAPFPEDAEAEPSSAAGAAQRALTAAAKEAMLDEATGLTPGGPQLLLSLLRLFELAADDTGLREETMEGLAGVMARALSVHHVAFAQRWCGGDVAVTQHLDDLVQVVSYTPAAVKEANRVYGASRWLVAGKPLPLSLEKHGRVAAVAAAVMEAAEDVDAVEEQLQPLHVAKAAALERALLLFKLLGNLHYWAPDLPPHQERRFVKLMLGSLLAGAADGAAFSLACERLVANMRALERFLEPICPDAEAGSASADVLLTQVEVDVFRDTRRTFAQLARTAWQTRGDFPVPKITPPNADLPDEAPEPQQDFTKLATAGRGDGDHHQPAPSRRVSSGAGGGAVAAAAAAAALGVKREAGREWDDGEHKRARIKHSYERDDGGRAGGQARGAAGSSGWQKPPLRPRDAGYGRGGGGSGAAAYSGGSAFALLAAAEPEAALLSGGGAWGSGRGGGAGAQGLSGRRAAAADPEQLTQEDLQLIQRLLSQLPQADDGLPLPLLVSACVPGSNGNAARSPRPAGGSSAAAPAAAARAGGAGEERTGTSSSETSSDWEQHPDEDDKDADPDFKFRRRDRARARARAEAAGAEGAAAMGAPQSAAAAAAAGQGGEGAAPMEVDGEC